MKSIIFSSILAVRKLALICSISAAFTVSGGAYAAGIIMPIFGNSSTQFNAAFSAAQKVSVLAVINPDNGPSSRKISSIANNASRLRSAGAQVSGYIDTYYGGEGLSSVYSQIDAYRSWYGATSIFLDEMSDKTSKVSYYRSIYNYAKKKGMGVVGNPGTFVPSSYIGVADVLVTYEDSISKGWTSKRPASWTSGYPNKRFAAIVYATAGGTMKSVVDRALSLNYGWIFVTDGGGNDPFRNAPSYLSAEADYIKSKNNDSKF
jgi:hypothetical protein